MVEAGDLCEDVRAEVVRHHQHLQAWLTGDTPTGAQQVLAAIRDKHCPAFTMVDPYGRTLDRESVLADLSSAYGVAVGLQIVIDDVSIIARSSELVVARYSETHVRPATDAVRRASTVVLQRDAPGILSWLHLHETWAAP